MTASPIRLDGPDVHQGIATSTINLRNVQIVSHVSGPLTATEIDACIVLLRASLEMSNVALDSATPRERGIR